MKKLLIGAAALALVAFAPATMAATANSTLTVNASVAANCTITNATLNFGAYDPVVTNATSPLNASTSMDVACTKGVNPSVGFAAAGGTITGGTGTLNYTLWQDNAHSHAFGPSGTGPPLAGRRPHEGRTLLHDLRADPRRTGCPRRGPLHRHDPGDRQLLKLSAQPDAAPGHSIRRAASS